MRFISKFILFTSIVIILVPANSLANKKDLTSNSHIFAKFTVDMKNVDNQILHQLSEKEQQWYAKFQEGLTFFDGWKQISEDILLCLPEKEKPDAKILLEKMGVSIGAEWSKSNKIRKIDTDQLHSWGKRIKKARRGGAKELSRTVILISQEADAILLQDLSATLAENSR